VVERYLWRAGVGGVAGVDEVGMGPLAGPVVAAAVVFAEGRLPNGIADSKRLTAEARERAVVAIRAAATGIGVGVVDVAEIDRVNIYWAGLQAMRLAIADLPHAPEYLLVDGRGIPDIDLPQTAFVRGDGFVYSVAAASIVAKVYRDGVMRELDAAYPEYGFRRHVGYATPEHLAALETYGPTPLHRRSFAPCAAAE
jgi:ribonuclease HII